MPVNTRFEIFTRCFDKYFEIVLLIQDPKIFTSATMVVNLRKQFSGTGLKARLMRGGVGGIFIKLSNMGLGFALAVVLSRVLGVEGYGLYSFAIAIISLAAIRRAAS